MLNVDQTKSPAALTRRHWIRALCIGAVGSVALQSGVLRIPSAQAQQPGAAGQGAAALSAERELAMKIKGPFTLAAVGDIIMRNPAGQLADPGYRNLIKPLQNADVAFANMEGNLIDFDSFPHPTGDAAPKAALADIRAMGIDIMGTANNHSLDLEAPGLLETIRLLNEGGIVHAGTGRNLQEARAARFLNTPNPEDSRRGRFR